MRPVRTGAVDRCLWSDGLGAAPAEPGPLPARVDVAIVGGGYTGLAAARALGRHGARVAVLERHRIGWGASGRNGGFVLPGLQPGLTELVARLGEARARELWACSMEAVRTLEAVVSDEAIDCAYTRCGSLALAASARHFAALAAEQDCLRRVAGHETLLLAPAELGREIAARCYHGGLLDPAAGSLHPGRYAAGLAAAAVRAGARLYEGAEVRTVRPLGTGFELGTARGALAAGEVLVATEGYTGHPFARLRRRLVPVGSYLVATAPLAPDLATRVAPGGRVMSDTRKILHYFRLSPDGRMVFGGRTSMMPVPTSRAARVLGRAMRAVFPDLREAPIDYAWSGTVAFSLDRLPHAGRLDGVHYAAGYGGHGVALATWLGGRLGDALAGRGGVPDFGPLRAIPLYGGRPWFLPLVDGWYRLLDRLG